MAFEQKNRIPKFPVIDDLPALENIINGALDDIKGLLAEIRSRRMAIDAKQERIVLACERIKAIGFELTYINGRWLAVPREE